MASSMFWKRLTILNIGLIFLFYKTYLIFEDIITNKMMNSPIFPALSDDGYPFLEKIDCDFEKINKLTELLENNPNRESIVIENKYVSCPVKEKNLICKGNNTCLDNLKVFKSNMKFDLSNYHLIDDFDGNLFWNMIYEKNTNFNKTSLNFIRKIISGYHSYINLILFFQNKDINIIKEKLTNSPERLNNLLYLYSLIYESSYFLNEEYNVLKKNEISLKYIKECINLSSESLLNHKKKEEEILIIFNGIQKIINCIPNQYYISKYSSLIDIEALLTMLKIHFVKQITESELLNFKFFSFKFLSSFNELFEFEKIQTQKSIKYYKLSNYFPILYSGILIIGFLYLNSYFIKNKEYYSSKIYRPKKRRIYYKDEIERKKREEQNLKK